MIFEHLKSQILHSRLSEILIHLKDNPSDQSNPELFETVKRILKETDDEINDYKDRCQETNDK
jgi:hypothetical protein